MMGRRGGAGADHPSSSLDFIDLAFPSRTLPDTLLLFLNLPILAVCAVVRALFWYAGIPLGYIPGALGWDAWQHASWRNGLGQARNDDEREEEGKRQCSTDDDRAHVLPPGSARPSDLVKRLVERGAHRWPHSHGRPFAKHLVGVPALVAHWGQPKDLCLAALFHSAFTTEMFPFGLFPFSARHAVRQLIGTQSEETVFLYCTVSQSRVYKEAKRLCSQQGGDGAGSIPARGFSAVNCQTGEVAHLPAVDAARFMLLLSADIMEQDAFFDIHLTACLLRLASPHLPSPPPLNAALKEAGFWEISRGEHAVLCDQARRLLLQSGDEADSEDLEVLRVRAPWLYEVGLALCKRGLGRERLDEEVMRWAELWGTPWTWVRSPGEEMERVRGGIARGVIERNLGNMYRDGEEEREFEWVEND